MFLDSLADRIVKYYGVAANEVTEYRARSVFLKTLRNIEAGIFTDDPKILAMENKTYSGLSIAHLQARKGWRTENPEILRLRDHQGQSVAHVQAFDGWVTKDAALLSLKDDHGHLVAEHLIAKGHIIRDNDVLRLAAADGKPLAYMQLSALSNRGGDKSLNDVSSSFMKSCLDIVFKSGLYVSDKLLLSAMCDGVPVAHMQHRYYEEKGDWQNPPQPQWKPKDLEVLAIRDRNGDTLAHLMAKVGEPFDNLRILSMKGAGGKTVAHYSKSLKQVSNKDLDKVLRLADDQGNTVAHFVKYDPEILADNQHMSIDKSILDLANKDGETVADWAERHLDSWPVDEKEEAIAEEAISYVTSLEYAEQHEAILVAEWEKQQADKENMDSQPLSARQSELVSKYIDEGKVDLKKEDVSSLTQDGLTKVLDKVKQSMDGKAVSTGAQRPKQGMEI